MLYNYYLVIVENADMEKNGKIKNIVIWPFKIILMFSHIFVSFFFQYKQNQKMLENPLHSFL